MKKNKNLPIFNKNLPIIKKFTNFFNKHYSFAIMFIKKIAFLNIYINYLIIININIIIK